MTPPALSILYEEPHFLLVDKPAGLFTQAAPGVPSLQVRLARQLKERDQHPGNPFIGLPHRLDRATSGVLLVARNKRALTRFGEQFQSRKIDKWYLAVVEGIVPPGVHAWDDFLRKVADQPQAEIVAADAEQAKLARMRIEPLATVDGRTLAIVQLLTGRMHQIRLQTAHRGWPIVGDRLYGGSVRQANAMALSAEGAESDAPRALPEDPRDQPHALHAFRLGFRHPRTALPLSISAPLPEAWREVFAPENLEDLDNLVGGSQLLARAP